MAAEEWYLQEEGCLEFGGFPTSVTYSATSNCFICTLQNGSVEVLDVSSGAILKRTSLAGASHNDASELLCKFCPGVEKLFMTNGRTVGVRRDLNGVFLLETILQSAGSEDRDNMVTLELTCSDAKHLLSGIELCFPVSVPPDLDAVELPLQTQLKEMLNKEDNMNAENNHKSAKWRTCSVSLEAGALHSLFDSMVTTLHKGHKNSSALPVVSAMLARLMALTGTSIVEKRDQPVYKQLMFVESARRETFTSWPHMDYRWALPDAMAQAGFYHQPGASGDDRAMCFTCNVCLVCWEPTDEPWSEHERHSPDCPFVKGEHTENVPMSVTLATAPAVSHGEDSDGKIACVSTVGAGCIPLIATSTREGHVVVWDLRDQLKVFVQFRVSPDPKDQQGSTHVESAAESKKQERPVVFEAWMEESGQSKPAPLLGDVAPQTSDNFQSPSGSKEELSKQEMDQCQEENESSLPVSLEAEEHLEDVGEIECVTSEDLHEKGRRNQMCVTAISLTTMCSQQHSVMYGRDLHSLDKHQPVLIAGISVRTEDMTDAVDCNSRINEPRDNIPYLHLYKVLPDTGNYHSSSNTQESKPTSVQKIAVKPQDPYLPYSPYSGEDDFDDGMSLSDVDVMPDTFHSTVLKKFADAIAGEPVVKKDNTAKSAKQSLKMGNVLQSIRLPEFKGMDSTIKHIVPCCGGHHVLVNVWLYGQCLSSTAIDNTELTENKAEVLPESNELLIFQEEQKQANKPGITSGESETKTSQSGIFSGDGEQNLDLEDEPSKDLTPGEANKELENRNISETDDQCNFNESQHFSAVNSKELEPSGCALLRYSILQKDLSRTLSEQPVTLKTYFSTETVLSCVSLPLESSELGEDSLPRTSGSNTNSDSKTPETLCSCKFAATTASGTVVIFSGDTLEVVAKLQPKSETPENCFAHLLHCSGIDCLCACTSTGKLHFLHLARKDGDKHNTAQNTASAVTTEANHVDGGAVTGVLEHPITTGSLLTLDKLTEFETLVPRFSATVPPCWTEIQQEQQHRRHPVHLHQQNQGDCTLHTRTWRLHRNGHQVKEQFFELVLPRQCCIGHVDVKFSLHSSASKPNVCVSLVRPWCLPSVRTAVSSGWHKSKKPFVGGGVGKQEHVLCGPVGLDTGMDSSARQGRVVLTSAELINTKSRTLFLVFKPSKQSADSASIAAASELKGCECLDEVSVTFRKFKVNHPHSLQQRLAMLGNQTFHKDLIEAVCTPQQVLAAASNGNDLADLQKTALNLLCWIAGVSVNCQVRKHSMINEVCRSLSSLMKCCFLLAGRSIAHKCSRLLLLCLRQTRVSDQCGDGLVSETSFRTQLLEAILKVLPNTPVAVSAGAVYCLFKLLTGVAALSDPTTTGSACVNLLTEISDRLNKTTLCSHQLLRSRNFFREDNVDELAGAEMDQQYICAIVTDTIYGLYATPLDSILFDVPPKALSPTSVGGGVSTSTTFEKPSYGGDQVDSWDAAGTTKNATALQGLLEVEPLHFICCSTSDGARVEKSDVHGSGIAKSTTMAFGPVAPGNSISQPFYSTTPVVPMVSASLAAVEQELLLLKQHQQQLVKLQVHKQQLEKHKQELEELAGLFPKTLVGNEAFGEPLGMNKPLATTSINLAEHKKRMSASGAKKKLDGTKMLPHPYNMQSAQRQLLKLPQAQVLVMERLHSGARHHVVLDFGCVVQLTDIMIPSCAELSSLSVDVWIHGEELDAQRIAVVPDIGVVNCVLKDLLPPPLCQYVKLTVIGRPRSNAKVRMNIGEFYGYSVYRHSEEDKGTVGSGPEMDYTPLMASLHLKEHLAVLQRLEKEVQCHYSIACSQLEVLLHSSSNSSSSNFFGAERGSTQDEEKKVHKVYQQCIKLQLQHNFAQRAIQRIMTHLHLPFSPNVSQSEESNGLAGASHDSLRVISQCLLETLLALMITQSQDGVLPKVLSSPEPQIWSTFITQEVCETLFKNLCVNGTPELRVRTGAFLLHACSSKPWWGDFLVGILQEFFSASQDMVFPKERVFMVIAGLGKMSPNVERVLESLLQLVGKLLAAGDQPKSQLANESVDLSLVGWLLLMLTYILDSCIVNGKTAVTDIGNETVDNEGEASSNGGSGSSKAPLKQSTVVSSSFAVGRWDFIMPPVGSQLVSQPTPVANYRLHRRKLRKQIMHHQKQLFELQQQQQKQKKLLMGQGSTGQPVEVQQYQQAFLKHTMKEKALKHIKDLVKLRQQQFGGPFGASSSKATQNGQESSSGAGSKVVPQTAPIVQVTVSSSHTLPVMQKLIRLLLKMDSTCGVDLFLIACKVVGQLSWVSRPHICLSDLVSTEQLDLLLTLCTAQSKGTSTWGGAWAPHALVSLLQDVLQGERNGQVSFAASRPIDECDSFATNIPSTSNGSLASEVPSSNAEEQDDWYEEITPTMTTGQIMPDWLTEFSGVGDPLPMETQQLGSLQKSVSEITVMVAPPPVKHSSAVDTRLEIGVEMGAECDLEMLEFVQANAVAKELALKSVTSPRVSSQTRFENSTQVRNGSLSLQCLLSTSFQKLFRKLDRNNVDTDSVLQLWLRLNASVLGEASNGSKSDPVIKIDKESTGHLLVYLATKPVRHTRTWTLALTVFSLLVDNWKTSASGSTEEYMKFLLANPNFSYFLSNVLSGRNLASSVPGVVHTAGPSLTRALHVFLSRMVANLDLAGNEHLLHQWHNLAMTLVVKSVSDRLHVGFLDSKVQFIETFLQQFPVSLDHIDMRVVSDLLDEFASLALHYFNASNVETQGVYMHFGKSQVGVPLIPGARSLNDSIESKISSLLLHLFKLITMFLQLPSKESQTAASATTGCVEESEVSCGGSLGDRIVQREETIFKLLQCLSRCQESNIGILMTSAGLAVSSKENGKDISVNGVPVSVEDSVLQLLCLLCNRTSQKESFVKPLLTFISSNSSDELSASFLLSEPMLWYILYVLGRPETIAIFDATGGLEMLYRKIIENREMLLDQTSAGSLMPVLKQLVNSADTRPNSLAAKSLVSAAWDNERDGELVNFAPFGTVTCSLTSAQQPDPLIKVSAPHRRARSATWSYHFYPEEMWCNLTIHLPTAVLLSEVHILPHTAVLNTCPSYVALDVSCDGTMMEPVCDPLPTSGLTVIKFKLVAPLVAQHVCIRCHRPRDSDTLGLSQIQVLGTSPYGPSRDMFLDYTKMEQPSVLNWVRLLHHCLSYGLTLDNCIAKTPDLAREVFEICTALLSSHSGVFTRCVETVVLQMATQCPTLGHTLTDQLLGQGSGVTESPWMCANLATTATVELLYRLCTADDDLCTTNRITKLCQWLTALSQTKSSTASHTLVAPGHVQAAAAIIWEACGTTRSPVICQQFTDHLFRSVYNWSQMANISVVLKKSLDHLLCAVCHLKVANFDALLEHTEAKALVSSSQIEDPAQRAVDAAAKNSSFFKPSRLATLAIASQSPITSVALIESGLLTTLTKGIHNKFGALIEDEFSVVRETKVRTTTEFELSSTQLAPALSFLSRCAAQPAVKTHLGENVEFWNTALLYLCSTSLFRLGVTERYVMRTECLSTAEHVAVESAMLQLLSAFILCHPKNQAMITQTLCNIMNGINSFEAGSSQGHAKDFQVLPVTGFTRRLILQLLLQDEQITVCLHSPTSPTPLVPITKNFLHQEEWQPCFGAGYSFKLLKVKLSATLDDISALAFHTVFDTPCQEMTSDTVSDKKLREDKLAAYDDLTLVGGLDLLESLSIAAGINVKNKRSDKLSQPASSQSARMPDLEQMIPENPICHFHKALGSAPLPGKLTVAQLMALLIEKGLPAGMPFLELNSPRVGVQPHEVEISVSQVAPLLSPLQSFASFGGLGIVSTHLPSNTPPHSSSSVNYPSYSSCLALPMSLSATVLSTVPAHSLAAFGLFVRLPGYAEELLKDRFKAQYLLRLLLGAEDDGEGGHIPSSSVASSLPTLPFQVLLQLLESRQLESEAGKRLRQESLDVGAVHLVLACLGILSHHEPTVMDEADRATLQHMANLTSSFVKDANLQNGSEKQYWAKGTGFGTGSTSSGWDIEHAMMKQRSEEEHVTFLLQVLSSYIEPAAKLSSEMSGPSEESEERSETTSIPLLLPKLLSQSCLFPALSSFLRNDSVLDMARHVPLYRAVLQLLRAMARCPILVSLLLPSSQGDPSLQEYSPPTEPSIASLLSQMKKCVDTYSNTLRTSRGKKVIRTENTEKQAGDSGSNGESSSKPKWKVAEEEADSEQEGLAVLLPDIQATASLVLRCTAAYQESQESRAEGSAVATNNSITRGALSADEQYLAVMKPLQFDTFKFVTEKDDRTLDFNVSYHFSSSLQSAVSNGDPGSPARARRLAQEISSLATSLPLSTSSSVFVRCDEERLDVMKVLITGPAETPYANGCFEFDVYFPQNYPDAPMHINFETTGNHSVRFNPNLYNDGKVCLSILNTWHGRPEEKWNSHTSSFLQVLVSTQSLILVSEPYFNEPGYERSRGTPAGQQNSKEYDANIHQATVRWAMLEQLRKPSPCFREVIQAHFYLKMDEIKKQTEEWIRETENLLSGRTVGRAVPHHLQSLKQNTALLVQELAKLKPPQPRDQDCLSDDSD